MSGHFIYPDAYGWPKWPHMLDENVQWPRYWPGNTKVWAMEVGRTVKPLPSTHSDS